VLRFRIRGLGLEFRGLGISSHRPAAVRVALAVQSVVAAVVALYFSDSIRVCK